MQAKDLSHFRRRRVGKTNYKKRLNMLLSGKPRMVVRRTNSKFISQIVISDTGKDKVVASVDSSFLKDAGWKHAVSNIPSAYLTGLQLANKAKDNKIDEAIFDIGLLTPTKGASIFAVLKGAVDGGIEIPHNNVKMPSDERMSGKHIDDFKKSGISKDFESFKKKILDGAINTDVKKAPKKKSKKAEKK